MNLLSNPPRGAQIAVGVGRAYADFASLAEGLTPEQWRLPTRCAGWQVRDIAGHITGLAKDIADGFGGTRTGDQQAAALRDREPAELVKPLRLAAGSIVDLLNGLEEPSWQKPGPVPGLTIEQSAIRLWHDLFIHTDDVRTALGLPSDRGPGLGASLDDVLRRLQDDGFGPARFVLTGVDGGGPQEIRFGRAGPRTPVVTIDALDFLMVSTGRTDPASVGFGREINIYRE
ncbi:maleylpyruvate isomerase family mycothiol-dependent enzyme [Sphaerisporangium aureirubrum]|uniref:Maleylpyruvate isomerase family mycothiol-dependent enzyme n=1 Tax=Sphaerisporangium aureirubrum TaxID=1544736 RepID=A0ABW1NFP0_9ACTN